MDAGNFIAIGENIHCTRIVKRNGKRAKTLPSGREAVVFEYRGEERCLNIPENWGTISPAFEQGKVKHGALAIHQAMNASGEDQKDGEDYLRWMAERQIAGGATFLDVNVDEFATDKARVLEAMAFVSSFLGKNYEIPLSIDSSDPETLRAGLDQCRNDIRPPMINSVSLEREETIDLVVDRNADAIVNATGREGMPCGVEDRMNNLRQIITALAGKGVPVERLHIDALVLPISTDPMNGQYFMQATELAVKEFPGIHANGGLSNISFGMPKRKLLNMVFTRICTDIGLDGGIIDPISMPPKEIAAMDTASDEFRLARAVLTGEDMFGMEFIAASRDGRI
jgi:cobalamin-dependent methionine synthase I